MRRLTRLTNAFSKKWENPLGSVLPALRVLQLLPHSSLVARDSGDGSRDHRSYLGIVGTAGLASALYTGVRRFALANRLSASKAELFLRGIEQISRAIRSAKKAADESPLETTEAVRQQQEEHEARKRRISQDIASGARISRNF